MNGYTIEKVATGYAVKVQSTGARVGDVHGSLAEASAARRSLLREETKRKRPCIACGVSFFSDGPHNRLCDTCRKQSADDLYSIGHRRARIGVAK